MKKPLIYITCFISFLFLSGCLTFVWHKSDVCYNGTNKGKIATSLIPVEEIIEKDNSTNNNDYEIYIMNPDGTNMERVTDNNFHDILPTWSPDGTKIAYFRLIPAGNDQYDTVLCIYNTSLKKETEHKLSIPIEDYFGIPFFISDTRLMLSNGTKGKIRIIDIDNDFAESQTPITGYPTSVKNGVIAYMSDKDNETFFYIQDSNGNILMKKKEVFVLPQSIVGDTIFYLAYTKREPYNEFLQVRSLDTKTHEDILVYQTRQKSGEMLSFAVSADKKYFAIYLKEPNHILIYNISASKTEGKFTFADKLNDKPYPVWSPDNKTIYFWIGSTFYHINPQGETVNKIDFTSKFKRKNEDGF